MEVLFRDFQTACHEGSGPLLAATISPIAPPNYLNRLDAIYKDSNVASISRDVAFGLTKSAHAAIQYPNPQIDTWTEIYSAYWYAIGGIIAAAQSTSKPDWLRVYMAWKDLANTIIKHYSSGVLEAWTLPVLYMAGKHLRIFAIKADEAAAANGGDDTFNTGDIREDIAGDFDKNQKLEDAARVINRMFTLCISDRAPLEESRKWGLYYTANLQFKTYFKLNSPSLCKNVIRALGAGRTDMPDLDAFPRSHVVTWKYYVGVLRFLEEDYAGAEESLTSAWHMCHRSATRNIKLILTYLIPTCLLTRQLLPSPRLLAPYPRLAELFTPLVDAIRSGALSTFDAALADGEAEFVKRRIYLTLERGRDMCLRNLLRKVYLAAGMDEEGKRRTRIRVDEFGAAIRLGERGVEGENLENDEVECMVANMIYKNLIKGYISRAHGMVVLSKNGAFPGTGI
ncbi:hypothetical protein ABVK25_003054 [Lepraria finkii]|uniref:PCI domain-containing protein n=1 Tax=Lepraria finkii TaxID=1340010 RepID=A0ABR4BFP0_9LECA